MKADLEDFRTGWYGLRLGLTAAEIDDLIDALRNLKDKGGHFHYRSDFTASGGVGDIMLYLFGPDAASDLELEASVRPLRR